METSPHSPSASPLYLRNNMNEKRNTVKFAFVSTLPVMAGYLVLGCGFGILLQSKGYSLIWSFLMSLTIYAGSMQFVAIDLLTSGASLIAAALMTLMVNIRHIFYGITMLDKYKKIGAEKPYLIFALTDETFSLVCSPNLPGNVNTRWYYFFVSLFNHIYWVSGSVIGSLIGTALPFNTAGIDFAMTALFVVIFVEQWEKTKNHIPAVTGLVLSIVCLVIFGADGFLIPSMISITAALFIEKRWIQEKNGGKAR